MSLLFICYDFEKMNWKPIKQMFRNEGEEINDKDDIRIIDKGIFAIADSAITTSGGTKTLLTGFRKVYDMKAILYKPDFAPDGSFRNYSYVYNELPFIVGFAGSTLVAQHIINTISGHLEKLEISCQERNGYEPIKYIINLPCENNLLKKTPIYTQWDDDTFLDSDFKDLLSGDYISNAIEHSINHALVSAKKHRLDENEFNQMYTDIFCGLYCPVLKEHQIYIYRMQSKFEEGILEVYTEKEKLNKNEIAVLGMRKRFEKKAKTTFLEEVQKDTPNVVNTLIDLMCKCIEEVHEDGSFEINKPIVYKSLDRGRIKKGNIN